MPKYPLSGTINITTDAAGDGVGYSPVMFGYIELVAYAKDGTTPFEDTVDFTITTETTLQNVWVENNVTASKICRPRVATQDTAGVNALYAAAGETVKTKILLEGERLKIVVANGGNAKLGAFRVLSIF